MYPKISIIIPMYNTGQYLSRCLDSVCGQTLRDIEILCINDASPDNALDIARSYASHDGRITVIDFSRNRGVSAARNAAMGMACGEYLGFVDSDDVIDVDFYEKLYNKACETAAPIVKGTLVKRLEDGSSLPLPMNDKIRRDKNNFGAHWTTAIYKTTLIRENGIDCPIGVSNNQDVAFQLKAVSLASCVETVDDACYYYCRRSGSSNSDVLEHKKILAVLKSFEDVVHFLNTRSNICESDYDTLFSRCVSACGYFLQKIGPTDELSPVACAEAAIKFHQLCKRREALEAWVLAKQPFWHKHLLSGDVDKLAKDLPRLKTRQTTLAANLRARLELGK